MASIQPIRKDCRKNKMLRKNQGANFLFIVIRKGAHKASLVVFGMDTESQVEENWIYSSSKGVLLRTLLFPSSLSFIAILEESPPVGKINSSSIFGAREQPGLEVPQ